MKAPKITLTIDRIVTDQPGLAPNELSAALEREIKALVATDGIAALGSQRSIAVLTGPRISTQGQGTPARTVARATLGAIGK